VLGCKTKNDALMALRRCVVICNGAGGLGSVLPGALYLPFLKVLAIELSQNPANANTEDLKLMRFQHSVVSIKDNFLHIDSMIDHLQDRDVHVHTLTGTAYGRALNWILLLKILMTPFKYVVVVIGSTLNPTFLKSIGLDAFFKPLFSPSKILLPRVFYILMRTTCMGLKEVCILVNGLSHLCHMV
jgi:hypothetical protein